MTYKSWKDVLDEDIKDCGNCLVNMTTFGAIIFATIWVCINTLVRFFKLIFGIIACILIIPLTILGFLFIKNYKYGNLISLSNFKYVILYFQTDWGND